MKKLLAFDLGTTTGWAACDGGDQYLSGRVNFQSGRYDGGGMRFLRFRDYVRELIQRVEPEAVYYEEVRQRPLSAAAGHVYGGFLSQLQVLCEELRVPYAGIPVGTIKKHATGKGNANKPMMIDACRARGYMPGDDNEADALMLLDYVARGMP